jgi:hypothetical protein
MAIAETIVQTCDFSKTHLHFRIDVAKNPPTTVSHVPPFTVNHVRVSIDCRLIVEDKLTSTRQEYFLSAPCKSERVGVERDVWTKPNADVLFVANRSELLIVKTFDHSGRRVMLYPPELGEQPHRQLVNGEVAYDLFRVDTRLVQGRMLADTGQIIAAVLANERLVSRTHIENDHYHATIEYPIKTINCSEPDVFYQTDTGPVLLPDLDCSSDQIIERLQLAFIAHSCPDWAELIVRQPTPINSEFSVEHYSKSVRLENVQNEVYLCGTA